MRPLILQIAGLLNRVIPSGGTIGQVLGKSSNSDYDVAWITQSGSGIGDETDPIFIASPAYNITSTNIANWITGYSWGNHATQGYLKTETDPIFLASASHNIVSTDITHWNSAYEWGNHASAGYLTTENDPIYVASAAHNITNTNITNWNDAYTKEHVHSNLALLETVISSGNGLSALFNDGTYKVVTMVSGTDTLIQFNKNGVQSSDATLVFNYGSTTLSSPTIIGTTAIQIGNSTTYIAKDGSNNMTFTDAITGTHTLASVISASTNYWTPSSSNIWFANKVGIGGIGTFTEALEVTGNITATDFNSNYLRYKNSNLLLGPNAGDLETGYNLLYIDNSNTSTPLIGGDFLNRSLVFNADTYINSVKRFCFGDSTVNIHRDTSNNLVFQDQNANSGNPITLAQLTTLTGYALKSDFISYAAATAITLANLTTWGKASVLVTGGSATSFLAADGAYHTVTGGGVVPTDNFAKWDSTGVYYRYYSSKTEAGGSSSGGKLYIGTTDPTNSNRLNYDGLFVSYGHNIPTGTTYQINGVALAPSNIGAEPTLGNPGTDGYILSSTVAGVRSWVAPSSITGRTEGSGLFNTAIGVQSLSTSTTGSNNTSLGYKSLFSITDGSNNFALGSFSLFSLTTGSYNVAIGYNSGHGITTAGQNISIGSSALYTASTGALNIAIGGDALKYTNSFYNVAIGTSSLYTSTGLSNTATGIFTGTALTTGSNNALFGYSALFTNIIGSANTIIGSNAGYNTLGSGNVFLGYQAGYNETGSNKLYISNSNTNTPLILGDFSAVTLTLANNATVSSTGINLPTGSTYSINGVAITSGVTPVAGILNWDGTAYNPYTSQIAGKFDTTTVAPWGSTRLNYNGVLYATQMHSQLYQLDYSSSYTQMATGSTGFSITNYAGTNEQLKFATSKSFITLGNGSSAIDVFKINRSGDWNTSTATGNLITVTDAPTNTTGTVIGKVFTAIIDSTERISLNPRVVDSSSAVAYMLDTSNALATSGAKIITFKTQGLEVANIDWMGMVNSREYRSYDTIGSTTDYTSVSALGITVAVSGVGKTILRPKTVDGPTAVAYLLDTVNNISTVGAKLLSIKNYNTEKFSVDKDGNVNIPAGSVYMINNVAISAGSGTTATWGSITGALSSQTDLVTAINAKETALGNPSTSGYVLSSTTAGVRSWIAPGGTTLIGRTESSTLLNTAFGYNSLNTSTTGYRNSSFGFNSLLNNTSGSDNTSLGWGAGTFNTTGVFNTSIGSYAAQSDTTSSYNTTVGGAAGGHSGGHSVFLGYTAGLYETSSNVFYVDSYDRTTLSSGRTSSLLYGTFNATPASQTLTINAAVTATYGMNLPAGQTYKVNGVAITTGGSSGITTLTFTNSIPFTYPNGFQMPVSGTATAITTATVFSPNITSGSGGTDASADGCGGVIACKTTNSTVPTFSGMAKLPKSDDWDISGNVCLIYFTQVLGIKYYSITRTV